MVKFDKHFYRKKNFCFYLFLAARYAGRPTTASTITNDTHSNSPWLPNAEEYGMFINYNRKRGSSSFFSKF